MLDEQLQTRAIELAKQCQYDWNEPETIDLIFPHLDEIKFLFDNLQKLKITAHIAGLFCRVGALYLHDLRAPEEAKPFLYGMVRYVKRDAIPHLWQELNNQLAFYHQQRAFRLAGKPEAKLELLQSNEFCFKILNVANVTPKKYDQLKIAFTHCIQALNSGEEKNYHDADGYYNEAFEIYDILVPKDKIDNQSLRAKARDAQFLIEMGYYQKALGQFEAIIEQWRLLGEKIKTHPYAFRTFLAYAKSLMLLAQKNLKVNLDIAKAYAQEAYDIQFAKNVQDLIKAKEYAKQSYTLETIEAEARNHPSLNEAKAILAGIDKIDRNSLTVDLVDFAGLPNEVPGKSVQELLRDLSQFNRDNLTGNFEHFYQLMSELKVRAVKCFEENDMVSCFKIFKQLAIAHTHAAKFESGIYYFKAALIAKENDTSNAITNEMMSDVFQTLGTNLVRLERFVEGKAYGDKALQLREPFRGKFEYPKGYNAFWHTTMSLGGNVLYGLDSFTLDEKIHQISSVLNAIDAFEDAENYVMFERAKIENEIKTARREVDAYQDMVNRSRPEEAAEYAIVLQDMQSVLMKTEAKLIPYEQTKNYLPFQIAEGYLMMGNYYLERYALNRNNASSLNLAFESLNKSSTIYKTKFGTPPIDYSRLLNKLAFYYLVQNEYESAEHHFKSAEKFVDAVKLPTHHICETYLGLQLMYEKVGNPELVAEYSKKYIDSRQSIYGEYVENGQLEMYMRKCFMTPELSNQNQTTYVPQLKN